MLKKKSFEVRCSPEPYKNWIDGTIRFLAGDTLLREVMMKLVLNCFVLPSGHPFSMFSMRFEYYISLCLKFNFIYIYILKIIFLWSNKLVLCLLIVFQCVIAFLIQCVGVFFVVFLNINKKRCVAPHVFNRTLCVVQDLIVYINFQT